MFRFCVTALFLFEEVGSLGLPTLPRWDSLIKSPSRVGSYDAIVICGPSGVGKGTILSHLLELYPDYFDFAVSHTTRLPRPNEVEGRDYHFIDRDGFDRRILGGGFLEYAEVHGNVYGTSKEAVRKVKDDGKICILDLDVQGVQSLQKCHNLGFNPYYIFIEPPSIRELEARLRNRGTENEEELQRRMSAVQSELSFSRQPGRFDTVIVNNELSYAVDSLILTLLPNFPNLLKEIS